MQQRRRNGRGSVGQPRWRGSLWRCWLKARPIGRRHASATLLSRRRPERFRQGPIGPGIARTRYWVMHRRARAFNRDRSADHIRASGHERRTTGRTHDLHPTASASRQGRGLCCRRRAQAVGFFQQNGIASTAIQTVADPLHTCHIRQSSRSCLTWPSRLWRTS
jgi:hypothetical protein